MAARAGTVSFGCVLRLWLDHVTEGLRIECAGRKLRAVTKRRACRHWFDFACQRQTWRDREDVASDFGDRLARSRCLRAWHYRCQQLWWAQWLVQSSCDRKVDVVARRCLVAWRTLQADGRRRQAASYAIARRSRSTAFRSWHLAAACCSTALVQASRRARALQRRSFIEWRRLATSRAPLFTSRRYLLDDGGGGQERLRSRALCLACTY